MPNAAESRAAPSASAVRIAAPGLDRGLLRGFVGPELRMVRNLLGARIEIAYAPFGLPSGAHSMMALISRNEGCSQSDLARETGMDKSAVVAILDHLQAKALITRTRSRADRRRHLLAMTGEGREVFARMQVAAERVEEPIGEVLTPVELSRLLEMLERVRRALEASPLSREPREGASTAPPADAPCPSP